jgi:hypothetical protein
MFYERDGDFSFKERLSLAVHVFLCKRCASKLRRFEDARELLAGIPDSFVPVDVDFEDTIMARLCAEEEGDPAFDIPGGFSTKGWVIAGVVILVSLSTSFFSGDFISIAVSQGSAFLLPLGIMIGILVSAYGALFIGSHLKEFSERFRLH